MPDLVGAVDLEVVLPDPLDMAGQHLVALFTRAAQGRVLLPGGMPPVHRRGNLKDPADRLHPETVPVLVDERLHDFPWRSSSAWAKKRLPDTGIGASSKPGAVHEAYYDSI